MEQRSCRRTRELVAGTARPGLVRYLDRLRTYLHENQAPHALHPKSDKTKSLHPHRFSLQRAAGGNEIIDPRRYCEAQ